jgi:hypothetical protein
MFPPPPDLVAAAEWIGGTRNWDYRFTWIRDASSNGLVFAVGYYGIFRAVGHAGWGFGAALGVAHAALSGGALVTVLLPAVHPRMGTLWSDAEETPLLEPPGFMLVNYGRRTALWTLVVHIAYGAIVGGFAAQLG